MQSEDFASPGKMTSDVLPTLGVIGNKTLTEGTREVRR